MDNPLDDKRSKQRGYNERDSRIITGAESRLNYKDEPP